MKRVLIVGSQHGNEHLGEQLYEYAKQQSLPGLTIDYLLANPRARKANIRFVESDMNRSYGGQAPATYESKRAKQVLATIAKRQYDLVIDAHTTTVQQPACFIVHGITAENTPFLKASRVKNVVVMQHAFVAQALIGHVPQAISLEVSVHDCTPQLLADMCADLAGYAHNRGTHLRKDIFVVKELLERGTMQEADIEALQNFKRCKAGFYPVLVGENSYRKHTNYLGFKAESKQSVSLL